MADSVRVKLREPLVNVGRVDGGVYNPQNNTTVFSGEVKVSPEMAEDLERRADEWQKHQDNLHRDNGQRDLNAGGFTGNQA
jgi:hypothetical protein